MKRVSSRAIVATILGIFLPALALAQFQGPSTQPPSGNAPGVIWNSTTPQSAQFNITGKGTIGGDGTITKDTYLNQDVYLKNGFAFRDDVNGASSFQMGNWGDVVPPKSPKPFTFNINGGLNVSGITANPLLGQDGRLQADKFCFNPGGAADCITSWPSSGGGGAGTLTDIIAGPGISVTGAAPSPTVSLNTAYSDLRYVERTGDTMSGDLKLTGFKPASIAYGSTSTLDVTAAGQGTATFTNLSAGKFFTSPPSTNNPGAFLYGVNATVNNNGANALEQDGVAGTSILSNGTITNFNGVKGTAAGGAGAKAQYVTGVQGEADNGSTVFAATRLVGTSGVAQSTWGGLPGVVNAYGLYGIATNIPFLTGEAAGVYGDGKTYGGKFNSSAGIGVYGLGASYGGYFNSTAGNGVAALASPFEGGNFSYSGVGGGQVSLGTAAYDVSAVGKTGVSVSIKGNGRFQSGDATDFGGMWVSNHAGVSLFVGQDQAISRGDLTNSIGFWNNGWRLDVLDNGNVGIGTAAPATKLQVVGDVRIGTGATNGCVQNFAGTALAGTCSSDQRLKTNVQPLASGLDTLMALRPVTYNWRANDYPQYQFDGKTTNLGLIAQEVQKVDPSLVGHDDNGMFTGHYEQLPFITIKAVQQQQAEIDQLKQQNSELKSQIDSLAARLDKLEQTK